MDPDIAWEEIADLWDALEDNPHDDDARQELAQRMEDLAGWIRGGGFLPEQRP